MAQCIVSQTEQIDLLKAYKEMRERHSNDRPFFMLIQYVPIGKSGGKVVCRPVLSPVVSNGKSP